jgi:hypothetical protein
MWVSCTVCTSTETVSTHPSHQPCSVADVGCYYIVMHPLRRQQCMDYVTEWCM